MRQLCEIHVYWKIFFCFLSREKITTDFVRVRFLFQSLLSCSRVCWPFFSSSKKRWKKGTKKLCSCELVVLSAIHSLCIGNRMKILWHNVWQLGANVYIGRVLTKLRCSFLPQFLGCVRCVCRRARAHLDAMRCELYGPLSSFLSFWSQNRTVRWKFFISFERIALFKAKWGETQTANERRWEGNSFAVSIGQHGGDHFRYSIRVKVFEKIHQSI